MKEKLQDGLYNTSYMYYYSTLPLIIDYNVQNHAHL